MDLKLVKKFIALAKKEGVKSLAYQEGDASISVELEHGEVVQRSSNSAASSAQIISPESVPAKAVDVTIYEVLAPFVGTYYSSPGPDEESFTSVGAKVTKGQTVCILEAMKIMNEIESEFSGEVVEICVDNEGFVEYGQVILRIKKS